MANMDTGDKMILYRPDAEFETRSEQRSGEADWLEGPQEPLLLHLTTEVRFHKNTATHRIYSAAFTDLFATSVCADTQNYKHHL